MTQAAPQFDAHLLLAAWMVAAFSPMREPG